MKLQTFGRPCVARDSGEEVALQPLPLAVLAYLAVGGPRDRQHLADLFWHSSKNGLNSLSTTLNRVRAEVPGGLWVRGNTLVGTDLACDVNDLQRALDGGDAESVGQIYGAPFLGSLKLRRQSVEFEEWVLDTRTTLASSVELSLLQQARDLHEADEHQRAGAVAEQAWEIAIRDGFPSPDYFEAYHRILVAASRPSAKAVLAMAAEFGIALPAIEPIAFGSTDHDVTDLSGPTQLLAAGSPSFAEDPQQTATSQLFGCDHELEAIESSVAAHNLTTIVGLGGSGKTRLATEYFDSASADQHFLHRYWVNLSDVGDHDLVAPTIAATLGRRFTDVASLADGLPNDQPVLLVLDNFEHVLEAAAIAAELVEKNEAIRVLATSRVPLGVTSESLVQLSGLDTADQEAGSPAEQLFVSTARRAGVSDDRLATSSREAIGEVCRRVGGNPLAIEIVAGWVPILSPSEILDALSQSNELLGSPMVGELRSMDAVLVQSWATLAEAEQKALMLLAVFPAGLLTTEALEVAELPISSVGQLVRHSLVRLHVEGRITLHPLVASHALSELRTRPDLHRRFNRILSVWCLRFATKVQSNPTSMRSQLLAAEIANFTSAWSWDAGRGLWELHRSTLGTLRQFFTDSGRVSEGRALFATVVNALRSAPDTPQDLLALALEALAWFQLLAGEITPARAMLDEALALSAENTADELAQMQRSAGAIHLTVGEVDEAAASFTSGLALIADEPSALTASLQFDLAQAHSYRGERDQVRNAAREALQAGRSTDNASAMVCSYLLLGDTEVESDPERAIVLYNEGWEIAKEASLDHLAIYFPRNLGLAYLQLQDPERAEQYFADGMKAADAVGQVATVSANYVGRAEARLLRDATAEAVDDLKTGIRLALKIGAARYLLGAAVLSCRIGGAQASATRTKELLALTLQHPAADQDARNQAVTTWQDLFDELPDSLDPAADHDAPGLDEVAERSLELLTLRASPVS